MLHDAITQTIYLDYPTSQLKPTTTETRTNTLTVSSAKLATVYITSKTSDYGTTITETDLITVTNAQVTAASSGEIVTYSEIAASDGLYNIIVVNGTTYWLNGQTPAPAPSYVVKTSIITVRPMITSAVFTSKDETSTMTIHSTVVVTQDLTITETIPTSSLTVQLSQVSGYSAAPVSCTDIASSGWNASATAHNVIFGTSTGTLTIQTSLSSVNIYGKPLSIDITSYAAESGFYQFTTSPSSSASGNIASNTSTAAGIFTAASSTASGSSLGTAAVTTTPYVNSTSTSTSATVYVAQNTTGIVTTPSLIQTSTVNEAFSTTSCTDEAASTTASHVNATSVLASIVNSTSSTAAPFTSSVDGVITSSGYLSRTFLTSYTSSVMNSTAAPSTVFSTYTVIPLPKSSVTLNTTAVPATWITLSPIPTTSYSSASPTSTKCGEQGDFILNVSYPSFAHTIQILTCSTIVR